MNKAAKTHCENENTSRRNFLRGATVLGAGAVLSGCITAGVSDKPTITTSLSDVDLSKINVTDITSLSAVELSGIIKAKIVSCRQVMEAYLAQISKLNPKFNAIVALQDEAGLLAQADQCDTELAAGNYRGWMHGFPLAVKDLASTKGILTTAGSRILKENVPDYDDIFVERLKAAGGIIIGKTNVPEFGLGSHSYNNVYGVTLNAYDGKSTAGGSSGGAAAALALNMVPVADGSDMMGSLRNPAAYNNVIGFRPSFNRVPYNDKEVFLQQLAVNGPMGKTVTDVAMLLSTMAGYDTKNPLISEQDPTIFANSLKSDVKGLKIGWIGDFNGYLPMEEGVLETCEKSLKFFTDIGCIVENVSVDFPMETLWQTWLTHRHWIVNGILGSLLEDQANRALMKPEAIWELAGGKTITGAAVFQATKDRTAWYAALNKLYKEYDFLVLPTAQVFPFDASIHWPKEIAGKKMDTYHRWMEVVIGGTLSGCPALNVPAGFGGKDNKPMGMQIWAPMNKDLEVLKLGYAYEQVSRWNLDYPSSFLNK